MQAVKMITPIETPSTFNECEFNASPLQRFHFPEQTIQWPKKQALMQKVFDHRALIEASPGLIWEFLTRPSLIPRWNQDILQVSLNGQSGAKAAGALNINQDINMVGKIRILFVNEQRSTIQTQMITDWIPGESLGYTTLAGLQIGPYPVDMHIGLFKLVKQPLGVMVQWLNYLEFNEHQDGSALLNAFALQIEAHLIRLKTQAENAHILSPIGC